VLCADSGVGILNSNLGMIYELSGLKPSVKAIISSPETILTIKRKNLDKKKQAGYPLGFFHFLATIFLLDFHAILV